MMNIMCSFLFDYKGEGGGCFNVRANLATAVVELERGWGISDTEEWPSDITS